MYALYSNFENQQKFKTKFMKVKHFVKHKKEISVTWGRDPTSRGSTTNVVKLVARKSIGKGMKTRNSFKKSYYYAT